MFVSEKNKLTVHHRILRFVLFIGIVLLPSLLPAQSATGNPDTDLALYRGWLEMERKSSTYAIAHRKFRADHDENTIHAGEQYVPAKFNRSGSKKRMIQELDTLHIAFNEAFWTNKDYDKAFYIGLQLEEKLPLVAESEFPDKRKIYYKLGEAYYLFLDFHKSITLLEKALSPVPLSFDDTANLDALKIIGICYANIDKMDISDDYFRATLLSDDLVFRRPLYNAYAVSHLGCNEMLKGNYDNALKLSLAVWPTLRQTDDYGHLAGMCYCRGRSFLQKGDYRQASHWIDSLVYFARRDQYNYTKRIKQAYLLQADYFSVLGDAGKTKTFNDSLVSVYKSGEREYTSQYITRAMHKHNSEKIEEQENRIRVAQNYIIVISFIALLGIVVSSIIWSLYRKKNEAYVALAKRAIEWAQDGREEVSQHAGADGDSITNGAAFENAASGMDHDISPTDEDRRIMALIECEVVERSAFLEHDLTGELLAARLHVHRNNISQAVNRITKNNLNHYINSYRIKEAIKIISETDWKQLNVDELYERVGFGSRPSFYRVFKQFTGLSPVMFQKKRISSLS